MVDKEEVKELSESPAPGGFEGVPSEYSESDLPLSVTSSERGSPIILPTTTDLLFPGETSEILSADVIEEVSKYVQRSVIICFETNPINSLPNVYLPGGLPTPRDIPGLSMEVSVQVGSQY